MKGSRFDPRSKYRWKGERRGRGEGVGRRKEKVGKSVHVNWEGSQNAPEHITGYQTHILCLWVKLMPHALTIFPQELKLDI